MDLPVPALGRPYGRALPQQNGVGAERLALGGPSGGRGAAAATREADGGGVKESGTRRWWGGVELGPRSALTRPSVPSRCGPNLGSTEWKACQEIVEEIGRSVQDRIQGICFEVLRELLA